MIEQMMYLGIGFLSASFIALLMVPAIHGRAVRLTERRLQTVTPLAAAEIQTKKDQLRAEFAMASRRVEVRVEELETRMTSLLAELGRKSDIINRLKIQLGHPAGDTDLATLVPEQPSANRRRPPPTPPTPRPHFVSRTLARLFSGAWTAAEPQARSLRDAGRDRPAQTDVAARYHRGNAAADRQKFEPGRAGAAPADREDSRDALAQLLLIAKES